MDSGQALRMTGEMHLPALELEAGLDHIRQSPQAHGTLELIVRRPAENEREVLDQGVLDLAVGLVGDTWNIRGSRHTADGSASPECQINMMNARAAALVAQSKDRWPLAGDQLYIDFDLSEANAPPGTRLAIGEEAVLEITPPPHTGCKKFTSRFGVDAMKFVNSPVGRELHLRGVNAKVVRGGTIRPGDAVRKVSRGVE
jgi:hypothetical protein